MKKNLALFVALGWVLGALVLLSCEDEKGTDDGVACDKHCLEAYWADDLARGLGLNTCQDACDPEDIPCLADCQTTWGQFDVIDLNDCFSDCHACNEARQDCLMNCPSTPDDPFVTDPECAAACTDAMYDCTGWDRACIDGCEADYWICGSQAERPADWNPCLETRYGECLPGCFN